ncbi:LLM class flavin-dependent oxidoreductase [Pseudomonas sp. PDM18]|uniref:LLM class flavin-dependent oxidoreductase n=1 Tax=Pseudomonas sp. PDM18 TaxID=2769253 RepID=UPI001CE1D1A1|nr:LLM class flavin-dependent oxidoreductase [Pseudomonas sp. PDM18]
MTAPRQMALGAFLMATGHHLAGWRHPRAHAAGGLDVAHYQALARTAERGCFDAIFLSDTLAMLPGKLDALSRMARTEHFEPLTLLAHLAVSTRHIGLVATVTSSYNDAANVADTFATLESLSGGRSGWNLVTSSNAEEAGNFGRDRHFDHACRYRMAEEFLQRVRERWAARGVAPVQVLAGASEAGRELAAQRAEVLFTAQPELAGAQAFFRDIKQRAARHGRDPDALKVMPGVLPILGASRAEADERRAQLQELVQPVVGLSLLSDVAGGFDLSRLPLDGPLPELPPTESGVSRQHLLLELARREGLSIRQLYQRIADARGHRVVAGTAVDIADQLQEWFESGAADGFNIMPPYLPGGLDDFVAQVVPQLQHRGLFRRRYSGRTLRDHLGLAHSMETAEHG